MSYTSYQPNPSNTVQAQAITAIGDYVPNQDPRKSYVLTDGTRVEATGVAVVPSGSRADVGDFLVLTSTADGRQRVTVWKATAFNAHYQAAGSQTVTVQTSNGGVTRPGLAVVGGVVTLVATDTIVTNNQSIPLLTSAGATSTGNATLNSPATAQVGSGNITAVKASA